ncbi:MAG: hypothetical protein JXK93_14335 [Sphaerochaetaceae bacterium]|nr:hypothetical protein [Sphaerochaetaceae bacterium]
MKKRSLIVLLVLIAFAVSGGLYAASTFSLGSVNYYSYWDLEAGNSEEFIPGIRGEFFFSDYLGVSADAIVTYSIPEWEYYEMLYIVDAVFRLPLGLVEPYVATGPAFRGVIDGEYSEAEEEAFAYNVRGGVDFNILEWLSLGMEFNFLVDDVVEFIETFADMTPEQQEFTLKNYSLIGISAKIKF